jgi:hypothetical protein
MSWHIWACWAEAGRVEIIDWGLELAEVRYFMRRRR